MLNIQDTIRITHPSFVDAFLCNYYPLGNSVKIDNIAEYLIRFPKPIRRKNVPILFINEPGLIENELFANFQNISDTTYYIFKNGIEDEDFVEYLNLEDREAGFADITKGIAQIYDLDMYAAFKYRILQMCAKTNTGTLNITLKINGLPVLSFTNKSLTSNIRIMNSASETIVNKNDVVTVETTGIDTGDPTYLGIKLIIQRL